MSVRPEDLKATLRARARVRLESDAQQAAEVERRLRAAMKALPARLRPRRAWLIGSLAYGTFGARSDADVVVEGIAPADASAVWAKLSRVSPVPLDVLRLEELDDGFRRRVLEEGVPLDVA